MKKLYKRHAIYKNKKWEYNVVTVRTYEPEIMEVLPILYESLRKKEDEFLIYSLTAASDWEGIVKKMNKEEFEGVF